MKKTFLSMDIDDNGYISKSDLRQIYLEKYTNWNGDDLERHIDYIIDSID